MCTNALSGARDGILHVVAPRAGRLLHSTCKFGRSVPKPHCLPSLLAWPTGGGSTLDAAAFMLCGRGAAVRASVGTGGAGKLSGADRITVEGRGDGGARPEGFGDGGGGGGAAGCGSGTWCGPEAGALNCNGCGSGVPAVGRGEGCRVEGGVIGATPTNIAPLPRGDLRAGTGLALLGRVRPAFASRAIASAA